MAREKRRNPRNPLQFKASRSTLRTMKTIAQFEARLTWGGLSNNQRRSLDPIREGCVQIATALFGMADQPERYNALNGQINVWNYALSCAALPTATATGGNAA